MTSQGALDDAGVAGPRRCAVTEMPNRHANRDVPWWRYRGEPQALMSIRTLLGEDAGAGRVDMGWCWQTQDEITDHLRKAA